MTIKVIIADDHIVFTDGLSLLLKEDKQIEVVATAKNGVELLRQTEKHQPDIVLTDIQMPEIDGITAAKEISEHFPQTKIIALTMLNESTSIKKMLEAGISAYLLKTTDKKALIDTIKKVAAGEKCFDAEVMNKLFNDFPADEKNDFDSLTTREKEILKHIANGLIDKEIAEKVFLSPHTVITHRKNLLAKLNLKNKAALTRYALLHHLD